MFTYLRISMVAAMCVLFFSARAQETLPEILVRTTKIPQKESKLAKSAIILNDSLLQAHASLTMASFLQKQVGLSIVGSGHPLGSLQSVYMRGGNSGHTLLLLDGVPLYDPSSTEGNFDLNLINIDQIERIEVLKGGQSTHYGSDALAGVINFISKKNAQETIKPRASLSYGSFNTLNASAGISGVVKKLDYQINLGLTNSDGFSSAISDLPSEEKDGFKNRIFNAQIGRQFDDLELKLFGRISEYSSDLDAGGYLEDTDYIFDVFNSQFGLVSDWQKKEKFDLHLKFHTSIIERTYENDSTYVPPNAFSTYSISNFESISNFLELYGRFTLLKNTQLLVGTDWRRQSIAQSYYSKSAFGPNEDVPIQHEDTELNNISVFSSLLMEAGNGLGLELGARLNFHDSYGSNISYSINPHYELNETLTFHAVFATSFKNPSLYQLYSPYGNLDLQVENSRNFDIGLQFFNNTIGTKVDFAYFNRKHKNIIGFQNLNEPPYGRYENIDAQQTNGLELSISQPLKPFALNGNYTFLKGFNLNESSDTKTYNLLRRPKHQLNLGVSWYWTDKLTLSLDYQYLSKRYDQYYDNALFSSVDTELEAYSLVDLHVLYKLAPHLRAFASVFNMFNKSYTEIYGYQTKPINFRLGLSLN